MKLQITFLLLLVASSISAQENHQNLTSKWKLTTISVFGGEDFDFYNSIDREYIKLFASNSNLTSLNLDGMSEESYQDVYSFSAGFYLTWTFVDPNKAGPGWQRELSVGISQNSNREAMVVYSDQNQQGPGRSELTYCIINNIAQVNIDHVWKQNSHSRISLFAGIGGAVGASFNNDLIFLNRTDVEYPGELNNWNIDDTRMDANNHSVLARVRIPIGFDLNIGKNVSIGLEASKGIGIERVGGQKTYFTGNNRTFRLTLKRHFIPHQIWERKHLESTLF